MKLKSMFRQHQLAILLMALLVATGVIVSPVQAQEQKPIYLPLVLKGGGGVTTANSNTFDLVVSLYNAPTGAQRTAYEANIQHFADSVYEMSNGGHKIGQVRIYSNRQFADRADVVWVQTCWPNAHLSAYGRGGGLRIQMCDDFQTFINFINTTEGQIAGGYTIGHEWGHYFYGLMDEYVGGTGANPADIGAPLPSDVGVNNSIMNMQSRAVQGDFNWLNFSTALNNGASGVNAQRRVYQASAWETLIRPPTQDPPAAARQNAGGARLYYPELANFEPNAGQTPPLELPTAQTQARDQLQITWMRSTAGVARQAAGTTDVETARYIVIEKSTAMATNDKLFNTLDAVAELVDRAEIDDFIGIIAFDSNVTEVVPLTQIVDASTKITIMTALESIVIGDGGAATGNAARQALNEITAGSVPVDINRAVYLISGGPVTTGENLSAGVIPSYISENIELYTFGYGVDEATETKLQNAESTNGEYSFIDDSDLDNAFEELLDALENADQNLSPVVDVNIKTRAETMFAMLPITAPFEIDSTLGEFQVEVFYQGPITAASLQLLDPTLALNPATPDCEALDSGVDTDTICLFEISDPVSGTWTLQAETLESIVDMAYWVGGSAKNGVYTLDAEIESEQGQRVNVGETVILYTALANDSFKVTDVTLNAAILDPSSMVSLLPFVDDGTGVDDLAGDGIYMASYVPAVTGEYQIIVEFDNGNNLAKFTETGSLFAANPNTGATKAADPPVLINENFERFAEFELNAD